MNITAKTAAPQGPTATIHCDGSCPRNPGPMAIGYKLVLDYPLFFHPQSSPIRVGYSLPPGTNNEAEYHSLVASLRHALFLCCTDAVVFMDSQLIVNQVNGSYACHSSTLRRLHEEATGLRDMFNTFRLSFIHREENTEADYLSKHQTDQLISFGVESAAVDSIRRHGKGGISRRRLDSTQTAMIRWWYKTGRCRNEYRMGRIFGMTPSFMGRIGRGEKYPKLTEDDLPRRRDALEIKPVFDQPEEPDQRTQAARQTSRVDATVRGPETAPA